MAFGNLVTVWLRRDVVSNLAFLLVAAWVANASASQWAGGGRVDGGWGFALLLVFLGWASARYHAGVAPAHYDVVGMYAVGLYLFVAAIIPSGWVMLGMMAVVVPAAYWLRVGQLDVPMERKIGGLFLGVYAVAFLLHSENWETLWLSMVVLAGALGVRTKSHTGWHLVSAAGLAILWLGIKG